MLLSFSAFDAAAFERTQTCYPGRPPTEYGCKVGETPQIVRWTQGCIPWRIDETTVARRFFPGIQAAFETWNAVDGSALSLHYAGTTDQNEVGYDCRDGGRRNANVVTFDEDWERSNQIIGITTVTYNVTTGAIFDADIALNTKHYVIDTVGRPGVDAEITMDLQNVLTHEVGHFVGIDHTLEHSYVGTGHYTQATMFANTGYGQVSQRALDDDDKAAIRASYPGDKDADATCPKAPVDHFASPSDYDGTRMNCKERRRKREGCGCSSLSDGEGAPMAATLALVFGGFMVLRRRTRSGWIR